VFDPKRSRCTTTVAIYAAVERIAATRTFQIHYAVLPSRCRQCISRTPWQNMRDCRVSRVKRTSIRFPNPLLDLTLTLLLLNPSLQGRTSIGSLRRRRLWWGTGGLGILLELESNFLLRVVLAAFWPSTLSKSSFYLRSHSFSTIRISRSQPTPPRTPCPTQHRATAN
jgi:hypothetical protein